MSKESRPAFNLDLTKLGSEAERKYFHGLKARGVNFATGVPCGVQKHLISALANDPEVTHVPATRESEAIGIAAGAYMSGKEPIIYMQNSGLLNSINDITSLLLPYEIPILFSVTWRGVPEETAPQHFINGRITTKILDTIGIPWHNLTKENIDQVLANAFTDVYERQQLSVILVARGALK